MHLVEIFLVVWLQHLIVFSINPRIPPRVRFVPETQRVQIDAGIQSISNEMYDECFNPTSPSMPESDRTSDDLNSTASSGFDYLPRGPAQSLGLKCTNPDQLAIVGSCYF